MPRAADDQGLRYTVESVLELLAASVTVDEVLADHPDLLRDDVLAALEIGARAAGRRVGPAVGRVKFLIDGQLPARLAESLNQAGHDAVHTSGLPGGNRSTAARSLVAAQQCPSGTPAKRPIPPG